MPTITTHPDKVNRRYVSATKHAKTKASRDRLESKAQRQDRRIKSLQEKLKVANEMIAVFETMNFTQTQPPGVFGLLFKLRERRARK